MCPKPCKEEQNKPRQASEKAAKDYEDKHPKTDEETVKAWKASLVKEEEKLLGYLLNIYVKTGCGVVYHTYETSKPKGMDADETRVGTYSHRLAMAKKTHLTSSSRRRRPVPPAMPMMTLQASIVFFSSSHSSIQAKRALST